MPKPTNSTPSQPGTAPAAQVGITALVQSGAPGRDIFAPSLVSSVGRTGPALGNVETPDAYIRIKQNITGIQDKLSELEGQAGAPLTQEQLRQINSALQAKGSVPLVVTLLNGKLLQPQNAAAPVVPNLPSGGSDGQLIIFRNTIYRFVAPTNRYVPASSLILIDAFTNIGTYPANSYAPGTIFYATDTKVSYIEQDVPTATWTYFDGIEFNPLASLPAPGANNAGYLFGATDYFHLFRWDGSAWNFAAGDPGSAYVVAGRDNATAPIGGLWALCDGNNATVAQANGTTAPVTTPNLSANNNTFGLAWWLRR